MAEQSPEFITLNDGIAKLMPLLSTHGFSRESPDLGSSSAGRFAAVTLKRDNLEIGLIVRFGTKLGCPNYTLGNGYAGHARVMMELNPECQPKLVPDDSISYCAVDGSDPFDALKFDLETYLLPILSNDSDGLNAAVARAATAFQRELKGNGG
jgi:hypothetical protein